MHCRVSGLILYCYHRIHLEWLQRIHLEWLHFNGFIFNKLTLYDYRLQLYKKHLRFARGITQVEKSAVNAMGRCLLLVMVLPEINTRGWILWPAKTTS